MKRRLWIGGFFSCLVCTLGCGGDDAEGGAGGAGQGGAAQGGVGGTGAAAQGGSAGSAHGGSAHGGSAGGGAGGAAQGGAAGQGGSAGGAAGSGAGRGYYSTDRSEFFGASRCAELGAALCDDFEALSLDTGTWTARGAPPALDSSLAARGTQSLHFQTQGNGFSYISQTRTFPAPNHAFWGRMFVYIDALPVTPDYAHFTLVEGTGTGDTSRVRVGGQYRKFGVGSDGGPTGDWTNIDSDPTRETAKEVPEKEWICLEWQFDSGNNETRFFWDGVEHESLRTYPAVPHGANSSVQYLLPEFDAVWVGWWMYQSDPTPDHFDVWVDEVAMDGERIGCSL